MKTGWAVRRVAPDELVLVHGDHSLAFRRFEGGAAAITIQMGGRGLGVDLEAPLAAYVAAWMNAPFVLREHDTAFRRADELHADHVPDSASWTPKARRDTP